MPQPASLLAGQWANLPLGVLAPKAAAWGYDGLELASWGDHLILTALESGRCGGWVDAAYTPSAP